ncbi:uncharacterized protein LOC113304724 [Papaver somniferum]|uniref:uncharacterized protein LOC113304724 n=1 Tax=Papaver somniferum TaxID=3469 RepID=UPI000E6F55E7|nr:uncharacterized protein LOC113304724 [Papaver somniferum]
MEYVVVVGLVASDATFMTPNRIGLVFLHLMFAVLEASMIRCTNTNPISVGKRKKTLPVICMLGDGLMNLLRLELCRRIHVVFQQEQRYILVEQVGIPFFLC